MGYLSAILRCCINVFWLLLVVLVPLVGVVTLVLYVVLMFAIAMVAVAVAPDCSDRGRFGAFGSECPLPGESCVVGSDDDDGDDVGGCGTVRGGLGATSSVGAGCGRGGYGFA